MDSKNSDTWSSLGTTMSAREAVMVNGINRTAQECYLESIQSDSSNRSDPKDSSVPWSNLGKIMAEGEAVMVNGINRLLFGSTANESQLCVSMGPSWRNHGNQ